MNETLINSVYNKRALWNQSHPDHRNRYILDQMWIEVARECKISVKEAQAKWKNLRDYFRRELKKLSPPRSGDPGDAELKCHWVHFKKMLFLKDQFTPRPSQSNISITSDDNDFENSNSVSFNSPPDPSYALSDNEDDNSQNLVQDTPRDTHLESRSASPHPTPSTSTGTSAYEEPRTVLQARRRQRKNQVDALLEIEKQKMDYIQKKQMAVRQPEATPDEDKQFFDSLIPHVKKIADVQKLAFRNEIQNAVQRFAYPQHPPPQCGTQQLETFNYDEPFSMDNIR